jgi:hypothetical protein
VGKEWRGDLGEAQRTAHILTHMLSESEAAVAVSDKRVKGCLAISPHSHER